MAIWKNVSRGESLKGKTTVARNVQRGKNLWSCGPAQRGKDVPVSIGRFVLSLWK